MPQYSGMWTLSQVSQAVKNQTWTGLPPSVVEYLIVAGGGGATNGGGGAGGLLAGHAGITPGSSYFVTVGAGGTGVSNPTDGGKSVFGATTSAATTGLIVASGGGRGSDAVNGSASDVSGGAYSGGSGGGAYQSSSPGNGISGQGNRGGNATSGATSTAGGGGGAGTIGLNTGSNYVGANGGGGVASAISGRITIYAGGGAGGGYQSVGVGGAGGGGNAGFPGAVNSGGGGGGYKQDPAPNLPGAAGGSGIVIIRYPGTTQFFTGGTLSYADGYISHTFYANGTLVPIAGTLYANPDYQIARSLRFNPTDSTYLGRTPSTTSSTKILTYSAWVKRGDVSTNAAHFGITAAATSGRDAIRFESNVIQVYLNEGNGANVSTSAVFRDPSAWYHIVVVINTTQTISTNRIKVYVNGVLQTLTGTYPVQNYEFTGYNVSGKEHNIGRTTQGNLYILDGYLADINFIDGVELTPSSFGWTNPVTGVWAPLDFVGSYGTNGFNLNFSDNSNTTAGTLGADSSGNGNNWTPNNFSVSAGAGNDSLVDTPTLYGTDTGAGGEVRGNYATLNPLHLGTASSLTNGSLTFSSTSSSGNIQEAQITGTFGIPSSGKWYFEATPSSLPASIYIGVVSTTHPMSSTPFTGTPIRAYRSSTGNKSNGGTDSAYGNTYTTSDVIGVAVDMDAGSIYFYKNNTVQNSGTAAFTDLAGTTWIPYCVAGSSAATVTGDFNFGQRPFAYTAPSGYKALNTQNLPTPTIGATSTTLANKYFNTVLWAGNDQVDRAIAGVGFQPDWTWLKARDYGAQYHNIVDSVRGATGSVMNTLYTNDTFAEVTTNSGNYTNYGYIKSLDSDGFTVTSGTLGFNQVNWLAASTGPVRYVAWNWKAGGTAVTNTSGSITSSVSASPTSGFSIVTYTGNGNVASNGTIGHGLGVIPSMFIIKRRDNTGFWYVATRDGGTATAPTYSLFTRGSSGLNATGAAFTTNANYAAPGYITSSILDLYWLSAAVSAGDAYDINFLTGTYVAYCFAAVAGYSAFGSYTGNGSNAGPFVHTGFRPAWIMIKTSSVASQDWYILDSARDTYNLTANKLFPNTTGVENASPNSSSTNALDFLSNGFKLKTTNDGTNQSAGTYIYMAFASNPFKYSLAR